MTSYNNYDEVKMYEGYKDIEIKKTGNKNSKRKMDWIAFFKNGWEFIISSRLRTILFMIMILFPLLDNIVSTKIYYIVMIAFSFTIGHIYARGGFYEEVYYKSLIKK